MATLKELLETQPPLTSKANLKGVDTTPVSDDNPRGEFAPSQDLAKDEGALKRARGGVVNTKLYSDSVPRD
jgi:hypothetical protein